MSMPFEHLYQHIKRQDPRLYESLKRVEAELNRLYGLSVSAEEAVAEETIPNVSFFIAGTSNGDGTFENEMYWDKVKEKMCIDWAAVAPADRSNWSGCQVWIKIADVYHQATGTIDFASFKLTDVAEDEYYHYSTVVIENKNVPDPVETWTFICVSIAASGALKRDALGKPSGAEITLDTIEAEEYRAGIVTGTGSDVNYQVDSHTGDPVAQLEITFTPPTDAADYPGTYYALWEVQSAGVPDISAYVRVAAKASSPIHSTWHVRPKTVTERYYWKVVTNSDAIHPPPTADDPGGYEDVTAPVGPTQVSAFSVSLVQVDGETGYVAYKPVRLKWSLTIPDDDELWSFRIDKRLCNIAWVPQTDWQSSGVYGTGPPAGAYSEVMYDSWELPNAIEYWQFRARSQSHTGLLNDTAPPTYNLTVPAKSFRAGVCTGTSDALNYQVDPNDQTPSGQLEITFTAPADAGNFPGTYYSLWVCQKGSAPALGEYERVSAKLSSPIHSAWYPRPKTGVIRYYWKLVTNSDLYHPGPEVGDPGDYIELAVPSAPSQVSSFSVSMVKLDNATAIGTYDLFARIKYACTLPADNQFWNVYIERRKYTSATFTVPDGDWYWDGNKFDGMAAGAQVDITVDSFPRPNATEYWKFRAGARSHYGLVNTTARPEHNLTFAAQGSAIVINPTTGAVSLATAGSAQPSLHIDTGTVDVYINTIDFIKILNGTTSYTQMTGQLISVENLTYANRKLQIRPSNINIYGYGLIAAAYLADYAPSDPHSEGYLSLYYDGAIRAEIKANPGYIDIKDNYKLNGTIFINSTRDATFNSLAIDATGKGFDATGNAAAVNVSASGYVDSVGGIKVDSILRIGESGQSYPRYWTQSAAPSLSTGEFGVFKDTDLTKTFLVYYDGAQAFYLELTAGWPPA